jgi:hypothetical protein
MHSKSLNACRKESRTLFLLQLVERALPDPPLRQPLTATPKKKNYFVVLLRELREYCIREWKKTDGTQWKYKTICRSMRMPCNWSDWVSIMAYKIFETNFEQSHLTFEASMVWSEGKSTLLEKLVALNAVADSFLRSWERAARSAQRYLIMQLMLQRIANKRVWNLHSSIFQRRCFTAKIKVSGVAYRSG